MFIFKCVNCPNEFSLKINRKRDLCDKCRAKKYNNKHNKGEFKRNCPKCNKEIVYHYLGSFNTSKHKNSKCLTCRTSSADYPLNKINREVKLGIRKNGFADKKHTEEQKNKWSVIRKTNSGKYKTSEFRIKMSEVTKGEKNPMYGKTFYDIWLSKYGKEIADEKLKNFRAKQSELNSGEKNNNL